MNLNLIFFILWVIVGFTTIITELYKEKSDTNLLIFFLLCWSFLIIKLMEDIV